MYNTKVELAEEINGGTGNHLEPGIHKVFIESLKIEQMQTANYNGNVAKLVLSNDEGKTIEQSIFPFSFSPNFKKWGTEEVVPEAEQLKNYLLELKEIFSRAANGGEAAYDAATTAQGVTSFETFIAAISPLVTKATGGKYIWQLIKANKKNFSTIALHKGGSTRTFVEGQECPIRFDEAKYGKKQLDTTATEAAPQGAPASGDMPDWLK